MKTEDKYDSIWHYYRRYLRDLVTYVRRKLSPGMFYYEPRNVEYEEEAINSVSYAVNWQNWCLILVSAWRLTMTCLFWAIRVQLRRLLFNREMKRFIFKILNYMTLIGIFDLLGIETTYLLRSLVSLNWQMSCWCMNLD